MRAAKAWARVALRTGLPRRTALQAQLSVHTFGAVLQAESVATAMLSAAMRQYASRMFLNDANAIDGAADIRRSLLSRYPEPDDDF